MLSINNIQRVCFHDGPGIRTTVFCNFCMLKCPWCANPETSKFHRKYVLNNNCSKDKCPFGINCNGIKSSVEELKKNYNDCPIGAIEKVETLYSVDELYNILIQDEFIFGKKGGVTFSGGEPLLQGEEISQLIRKLKQKKINVTVESCLFAPLEKLSAIIENVDLFIIDIKILNEQKCLEILKGDLKLFLKNIDLIFKNGKSVIFRIPLISPYVTNENNIKEIFKFLTKYKPQKVEIFKGHNLAKEKYLKYGLEYEEVKTISDEEIILIKNQIELLGIKTDVINF